MSNINLGLSCVLHFPIDTLSNQTLNLSSVPIQDNNYDCGLYACRYVFNLVQMVNMNVKMKDVMDNLSSRISGHDLFDFDVSHIDRMRTEIYDVLSHITGIYRNHRLLSHPNADGTALDLASESEEDHDENDVTIFSRASQSMDESGNDKDLYSDDDASFLSQSHADDEEDDVLSADTTGKSGLVLINNSFAGFIMERRSILLFQAILDNFISAQTTITITLT